MIRAGRGTVGTGFEDFALLGHSPDNSRPPTFLFLGANRAAPNAFA